MMSTLEPRRRPAGFLPLGIFFLFGSVMATFAAITLLKPGTVLDSAWALNPVAHVELASMGKIMGIPFIFLAVALVLAALGWFKQRRWGWILGTGIIAINLIADIIHTATGDRKSLVGVVIATVFLIIIARSEMREYFHR